MTHLVQSIVVEIEHYNPGHAVKAPATSYVTQIVHADDNGVFTYAMPWGGWWGFSAVFTSKKEHTFRERLYPIEHGAVIWVYTGEREQ